MAITIEQAKKLKYGDILYHSFLKNGDGSPQRCKVNGRVKTWKRDPDRIYIPLKRGMHEYGHAEKIDLKFLCLTEEEAIKNERS